MKSISQQKCEIEKILVGNNNTGELISYEHGIKTKCGRFYITLEVIDNRITYLYWDGVDIIGGTTDMNDFIENHVWYEYPNKWSFSA